MYTLNKIIKIQEDFATGHRQVNDFVFDQAYSKSTKPDLKYPLLWTDLESSDISERSKEASVWDDSFTFNVAIVDLVRMDKSNEQEVLSDCKLMLNDFLFYLRMTEWGERLKIDINVSMTPVRMTGSDLTSGWGCKIKFEFVTDPDLCGIPTT